MRRNLAKFALVFALIGVLVSACVTGTPRINSPAPKGETHSEGKAGSKAAGESSHADEPTPEGTPQSSLEMAGLYPASFLLRPRQQPITPTPDAPLTPVTLFMGYIPNIQFAPVYMAIARGHFREAGIEVTIEHSFDESDGLTRIGTDRLQFGLISGEQVLLARAQGAPVRYMYRWYQKFPVGVVSPASANLTDPRQLAGKIVGVPGRFGASYIGIRALLNAVGLKEEDLGDLRPIGFDTAPVVCGGRVEASVVYIANEPAQIEARCFPVKVIRVADYANLVSNGIVTNEKSLRERPELVRGMVTAFHRGLQATIENPQLAYEVSRAFVETLGPDDPVQRQVLVASIELWKAERLGLSDVETWQRTLDTLRSMGLITGDLKVEDAFSNEYVPETTLMPTPEATKP